MDITKYQELTGVTVPAGEIALVTATLGRIQSQLEALLGYSLDGQGEGVDNEYVEIGKTTSDCPDPDSVVVDDLDPADPVIYAYRLFNYNKSDRFLRIDPATQVNKVKLVKDGVTFLTLDPDDYRVQYKKGLGKYIEICQSCWTCCVSTCPCTQLAVDANWAWADEDDIPLDLLYIWADMVAYYADPKGNIKSETLGPHSYTLFGADTPESIKDNLAVLNKYAGPNGSLYKVITI